MPLNSRDEFMEIKSFLEMGECGRKQVAEELELAFHNLPPAEFEEMQGLCRGKQWQRMCGGQPHFIR